jgi:hypothetical protein
MSVPFPGKFNGVRCSEGENVEWKEMEQRREIEQCLIVFDQNFGFIH